MSTPSAPSLLFDADGAKKPAAGRPVMLIEDVYPHAFWLEKYNRLCLPTDTVFDQFNPHARILRASLTLKPSSRADNQLLNSPKYVDDDSRLTHYLQLIDRQIESNRSKDRNQHMMLSSHAYGSHPTFDRFDDNGQPIRECFRPKRRAMLSDFSEQLVRCRITERPRFTGKVRFNL